MFGLNLKMVYGHNLITVWSMHFQNYCFWSLLLDDIKNNKQRVRCYLFFYKKKLAWLEMTNKHVPVDIVRIRPLFDGESSHWLSMGMGNPRHFQLGMRMVMGMYIYILAIILVSAISPSSFKLLKYSQLIK